MKRNPLRMPGEDLTKNIHWDAKRFSQFTHHTHQFSTPMMLHELWYLFGERLISSLIYPQFGLSSQFFKAQFITTANNGKRFFTFERKEEVEASAWCSFNGVALSARISLSIKSHINLHDAKLERLVICQKIAIVYQPEIPFEQTNLLSNPQARLWELLRSTFFVFPASERALGVCRVEKKDPRRREKNIWVFKINKRMNDPQCKSRECLSPLIFRPTRFTKSYVTSAFHITGCSYQISVRIRSRTFFSGLECDSFTPLAELLFPYRWRVI
jgi:hypothetical protein